MLLLKTALLLLLKYLEWLGNKGDLTAFCCCFVSVVVVASVDVDAHAVVAVVVVVVAWRVVAWRGVV